MSRAWTFYCTDCYESPEDFEMNHGEEVLREIYILRDPILCLVEAGHASYWLEVKVMGHYCDDLWFFLRCHYDHDVCLRDEYGYMEPLVMEEEKREEELRESPLTT